VNDFERKILLGLMIEALVDGDSERVNTLAENLSQADLWYCKERAEELYSILASVYEVRDDA
jgi:hypothetical protein